MGSHAFSFDEQLNPLDRVEKLAESRRWPMERTGEDEVVMTVAGGWCNLQLSLYWRDDLEALQFACTYDLKVPELRHAEAIVQPRRPQRRAPRRVGALEIDGHVAPG